MSEIYFRPQIKKKTYATLVHVDILIWTYKSTKKITIDLFIDFSLIVSL